MSDTFVMKIIHAECDLCEDGCGLFFFDFLLIDDFVKEITTFSILHDKVQFFGSFDDFVELDDKRVS